MPANQRWAAAAVNKRRDDGGEGFGSIHIIANSSDSSSSPVKVGELTMMIQDWEIGSLLYV